MALSTTFNRLKREIGIKKCVIVEGNVGDVYLNDKKQIVDLKQYLMDMLKAMDYDDVLYWDRIDGVDGDVSRLDVVDKVEVEGDAYSFDDDEEETTPAYEGDFVFEVPLDASHLNEVMSIPMGDWVEVDGQLLRFALDSYPTHGRLTVEEHPDNTASLAGLDFYLEDEKGNKYEDNPSGFIGGLGNSRMCDTTFFSNPAHLTLHITRLDWLEPEKEWVTVDLKQGVALDPLPDGV